MKIVFIVLEFLQELFVRVIFPTMIVVIALLAFAIIYMVSK